MLPGSVRCRFARTAFCIALVCPRHALQSLRPMHIALWAAFLSKARKTRFYPQRHCCFFSPRRHTFRGELRAPLDGAPHGPASPNADSPNWPHPRLLRRLCVSHSASIARPPGLPDGGVRPPMWPYFPGREESLPMRIASLLLPLTLALVAMTSGCHHRHWCCGGCMTPCCSPCGACCGYTPPLDGPVPPLAGAVPSAVVPHMPTIGSR